MQIMASIRPSKIGAHMLGGRPLRLLLCLPARPPMAALKADGVVRRVTEILPELLSAEC